jgi:hypothetical protein
MGGGIFGAHLADIGEGHMSEAHWHMGGAVLLCIGGRGYTLSWPLESGARPYEAGNAEEVQRQDYVTSGVLAVGVRWYHQHFNTGRGKMRQVAFRYYEEGSISAAFVRAHSSAIPNSIRSVPVDELDPQIVADYKSTLSEMDGSES